jgi:hypothetical protein
MMSISPHDGHPTDVMLLPNIQKAGQMTFRRVDAGLDPRVNAERLFPLRLETS